MIEMRLLRERKEEVKAALGRRGVAVDIDALLSLDGRRRDLQTELDGLRREKKELTKEFHVAKRRGEQADEVLERLRELDSRIEEIEREWKEVGEELRRELLRLPNLPDEDVPDGGEESNEVVKEWGERREGEVPPHWETGERLGILEFKRAAKLSGSRFAIFKGWGAVLERALINFMLDFHRERFGAEEVAVPHLVKPEVLYGTGQLPKFEEDLYRTQDDLYLIPTAEVVLVNLIREEVLERKELPLRFVAYTPCYRREAGSYGKDVRGIIRQHQFDKVELVSIVEPSDSEEELERITREAESVLEALGLPYRRVKLAAKELAFSSAKTYDLEVWMPGMGEYKEIASISNTRDFQTRRAGIRYKEGGKRVYPHALNGSGVAVGRCFAALVENYYDGERVRVPEVLVKYVGRDRIP